MAIVARLRVEPAGQDDHDRLQQAVESRLQQAGGPPDGLMAHLGHPDGNGFVIVEAWRSERLFRTYLEQLLLPALREVGLEYHEPEISPAWSIARP
jgi:hypothetical protein